MTSIKVRKIISKAEIMRDASMDVTELTVKLIERFEILAKVSKDNGEKESFNCAVDELEKRLGILNNSCELFFNEINGRS